MARLRLTTADDSQETARRLEQTLADYYPIVRLEKVASFRWYLYLPDSLVWQMSDADFMNSLVEQQNLLAGWQYQESERSSELESS